MLDTQKEYENVKNELLTYIDVVRKVNNSLYIGVTAVLAWAISASSSILCLLAYCVIIPVYCMVLNYNIVTMKMGTYLLVFHDDKWEKRLNKANDLKVANCYVSFYRIPFTYASIATTFLFFCFLDYKRISTFEIIQIIICIGLFLCFNIYIFIQKKNSDLKRIYINVWEKIKMEENET